MRQQKSSCEERIEHAAFLERIKFIAAADMRRADENLRERAGAIRPPRAPGRDLAEMGYSLQKPEDNLRLRIRQRQKVLSARTGQLQPTLHEEFIEVEITFGRSVAGQVIGPKYLFRRGAIRIGRVSNNTVEAEILYTRALYTLSEAMSCSLVSEDILDNQIVGIPFSHERLQEEEIRELLYRAKFARKLGFIQRLFNIVLTLPEKVSTSGAVDIRCIGKVVRVEAGQSVPLS